MKKTFKTMMFVLSAVFLLSIVACTPDDVTVDYESASGISTAIIENGEFPEMVERGTDRLEDYFYGIDMNVVSDASYWISPSGAAPDIIAVIRADSAASAKDLKKFLEDWLQKEIDARGDYHPAHAYKLNGLVIEVRDVFVTMFICDDSEKALDVFNSYF